MDFITFNWLLTLSVFKDLKKKNSLLSLSLSHWWYMPSLRYYLIINAKMRLTNNEMPIINIERETKIIFFLWYSWTCYDSENNDRIHLLFVSSFLLWSFQLTLALARLIFFLLTTRTFMCVSNQFLCLCDQFSIHTTCRMACLHFNLHHIMVET